MFRNLIITIFLLLTCGCSGLKLFVASPQFTTKFTNFNEETSKGLEIDLIVNCDYY
jgi:hypothetical protein